MKEEGTEEMMDIQLEEWRSSLPQVETEDEKVRTSPCIWRAAQRAISGVDSNRHAENVFDDCEVWAG